MRAGHYIGGQALVDDDAATLDVASPIDGSRIGVVELGGKPQLDRAVEAAQAAFPAWSREPIKKRVQVLYRFKSLIESQLDELADLVSRENGKTLGEARAEIERGLEIVEFACSIPNLGLEARLEVSGGVDCHTKQFPLGVVGGITPFNFPAMVPMWMFPVAIACGNAFVLKPSEQVPLAPMRLAALLKEAGLPDGVFNVVNGDRAAVEALLDHPGVEAVAFVGSSKVAKIVHDRGNAAGKRVLAMGGAKNHLVLAPDADPDIAAANIVASATGCAGQRCMAASVLVAVGDCASVIERVRDLAAKIQPGKDMGPVISAAAKERIEGYIERAERDGAKLLLDGRGVSAPGKEGGHYVGPTIIDGLGADHPCACEEIFGPVLTILRAKTFEEAIAIENANPYGNAAAIYTTSGAIAQRFCDAASAGMVGVNIGVPVPRDPFPFGGWNQSRFGVGDITGADGVRFWTQSKKITQKWTAGASRNWMS